MELIPGVQKKIYEQYKDNYSALEGTFLLHYLIDCSVYQSHEEQTGPPRIAHKPVH